MIDRLWTFFGDLFKYLGRKSFSQGGIPFPLCVRNRTLTLIEREDDTRSWGNFLVYFSYSTTMPCPSRGWGYILIGC
jgi:hypothetical protein